ELNCIAIFIIGFRVLVYHWDLYFTTVALLYIGEQVVWLGIYGFFGRIVVSELGHLSGALWGTVLAVGLLKAGMVDCEGWDLFALAAKRRKLAKDWKKRGELLDQSKNRLKASVKAVSVAAEEESESNPAKRAADAVRRVR